MGDSDSYTVMWLLIIGLWVVFGIIGYTIGQPKGMAGSGFWLGLLLGPLGLLIIAVQRPPTINYAAIDQQYENDLKAWAVQEAIRRDPDLAVGDDPETLRKLDESSARIVREAEVQRLRNETRKAAASASICKCEMPRNQYLDKCPKCGQRYGASGTTG